MVRAEDWHGGERSRQGEQCEKRGLSERTLGRLPAFEILCVQSPRSSSSLSEPACAPLRRSGGVTESAEPLRRRRGDDDVILVSLLLGEGDVGTEHQVGYDRHAGTAHHAGLGGVVSNGRVLSRPERCAKVDRQRGRRGGGLCTRGVLVGLSGADFVRAGGLINTSSYGPAGGSVYGVGPKHELRRRASQTGSVRNPFPPRKEVVFLPISIWSSNGRNRVPQHWIRGEDPPFPTGREYYIHTQLFVSYKVRRHLFWERNQCLFAAPQLRLSR